MFSMENEHMHKKNILGKLKLFIVMFVFMLGVNAYANDDYVYAGETFKIKSGSEQEAKSVHKVLYKGKSVKLKISGNAKVAKKKVETFKNSLAKVNKYGVKFNTREQDVKFKKKAVYIKINTEYAKQYREAILILKKMKKFYLNKNVKSLRKKLKYVEGSYDRYAFRKSEDKTASPEPGTYEEGDNFEIYDLYCGDDNSILSIAYFPEKGYYDLADYGNYSDDFEKGKYLEVLKTIKDYYYEVGSLAKHYKVDEAFVEKIKEQVESANQKIDDEIKAEKQSIEDLSESAVKYLKNDKYKTDYIACSKIKNNDFCDVSDAIKIYMISKCFVYDDGSKANDNPFIQYNEAYSGSSGGIVYHYDNNPKVFYMRDYNYEGNDRFFVMQKKGKVSKVLSQFRKGTFKGVCHDYATTAGYIYTLLGIDHYYGYSKKANHAISIVKGTNSDGKKFWIYQNYSYLGGNNDAVVIDGLCLKGKKYMALGATKKIQKQIRKSKFNLSYFN